MVTGDFNQTLTEHSQRDEYEVVSGGGRELQNCLNACELMDLPAHGPIFTWWNHQQSHHIAEKLDRVLGNFQWLATFPNSIITFEEPLFSDHASCCIRFQDLGPRIVRPFRFNHHLMQHVRFLDVVKESWTTSQVDGSPMLRISRKLKLLKTKLRELNRSAFSGIENRVRVALADLKAAQVTMLTLPSPAAAISERALHLVWQNLASAESTFLRQKSSLKWLSEGDENTSFFHKNVIVRNAFNGIKRLKLDDGSIISDHVSIKNACVNFYTSLFGTSSSTPCLTAGIESIHPFRCSATQKAGLERPFSVDEIQAEFFALPRDKALGPDGFTGEFFRHCWGIVDAEMTEAVLHFFTHGSLEPS